MSSVHSYPASEPTELGEELQRLAAAMDTVTEMPVSQLWQIHGDPDGPASGVGDGMLLADLPAAAIDLMIEGFQPPVVSFELRHLGGAFASRHGGVVSFPDVEALAFAAVIVPGPEHLNTAREQAREALSGLSWRAADQTYLNFAESRTPLTGLFTKDVIDRLRAVRTTYDPGNVILANHNVDPA